MVKSLEITLLHVASECLRILVDAAVLSREIDAIVLVRDGHLAGLEVVLDDLGGLRVVLGGVILDLLCYLERASVFNGLGNRINLDGPCFVGLVGKHGLHFEETLVEPLVLLKDLELDFVLALAWPDREGFSCRDLVH